MQTRNKNARNCSRSAKNLQTRNTHPFSGAGQDHSPLLRDGPESPSTHPQRFSGQGLISRWGPCPLEVPRWPKCGQGVAPEIRPCPSEGVLFTLAPFHGLSNYISSIGLQQKTPKRCRSWIFRGDLVHKRPRMPQFYRGKGYRRQGVVRLVGNAAGRSRTGLSARLFC